MQTAIDPRLPALRRTIELLSHAPIFRDLSEEELARIAAGTTELRAERGRLLFQRGDPCVGFHIVVFGQVKLSVGTAAGAEKVVEIIGPAMTFGEALMFTDRPYVVSATTLADSLIGYLARLEDDGVAGRATLPAQKSLVASRLNLTPEYFSRILHELAAARLVRIDGREIEILDPERLREFGSQDGVAQGYHRRTEDDRDTLNIDRSTP